MIQVHTLEYESSKHAPPMVSAVTSDHTCIHQKYTPPADNHPSVKKKDHTAGKPTPSGNNPPQTDTSEPPPQTPIPTPIPSPPKVSFEYSIDDILSNGNTGRDADDCTRPRTGR